MHSRFCPRCGTFLQVRPQPKRWLFQFNPSVYRWFDRIKDTKEPEQWLVSQHFNRIRKGDLVAIWGSGQKAGIYALGKIITKPEISQLNLNQEKYFLERVYIDRFQEKYSAFVEYFKVCLENPLLQDECNQNSALSGMQVFMNQQGTNFRLTREQWYRILELSEKT